LLAGRHHTHGVIPAKAGFQYSVSWLEYATGWCKLAHAAHTGFRLSPEWHGGWGGAV